MRQPGPAGKPRDMTTNFQPSDSASPRLLRSEDPAELLAMAHLSFMSSPQDDLVLIGHRGDPSTPVITRSALSHLLDPARHHQLGRHLAMLQARGCSHAVALLVVGDGYRQVDEEHYAHAAIQGGLGLFTAAAALRPDPLQITAAWVLGEGSAHELRLLESPPDRPDITCSPPRLLRPFAETGEAAEAVLTGRALPCTAHMDLFTRIGATLPLATEMLDDGAPAAQQTPLRNDPLPLAEAFSRAQTALRGIPATVQDPSSPLLVTQCEQLARFLRAMAEQEALWELLALCAERGNAPMADLGDVLEEMFHNPDCIPHHDVQAGGSWFMAIEQARTAAAAARDRGPAQGRATAVEAWRALTAALTLLHWWNHRYASAGDLVDELDADERAQRLALLLRRLTDTPIHPAWWPRR